VHEIFRGTGVEISALEHSRPMPSGRLRGEDSFPEVLYGCGFNDADELYARVQRVHAAIAALRPDALICDFAPTVMLANRGLRMPVIVVGNGFMVPVRTTPMPRFRYWLGPAPTAVFENELRVLDVINTVLRRCNWPQANSIADFLAADFEWLRTFPEFDFYGVREGARYLGSVSPGRFGVPPRWVSKNKPRVFAYLEPAPTTMAVLRALEQLETDVCVYAPTFEPAVKRELDIETFSILDSPACISKVTRDCSIFVNNASFNTVISGLLAGKPQLVLPLTAEKYLTGRRLELLGAGLAAPLLRPGDITAKLRAVLNDKQYARAAQKFAVKYRDVRFEDELEVMLRELDQAVGR